MSAKRVPVEIKGYVERNIWVVDHLTGLQEFRRVSWSNDDYSDDDFLPWEEQSEAPDDCPF